MDETRLKQLLEFSEPHVVVLGDVMLDDYIYGTVQRISPEAPVPVVEFKSREFKAGGAANVALNLSRLGAKTKLISVTGNDNYAESLEKLLNTNNLTFSKIQEDQRKTTCKSRIISRNQQILRLDNEDRYPISKKSTKLILDELNAIHLVQPIDLLILQDYNKGAFTSDNIPQIINWAKEHDVNTALDPKKDHIPLFKGVDIFKPNLKETEQLIGRKIEINKDALDEVFKILKEVLALNTLVITLSSRGIYINNGEQSILESTKTKSIIDVSGAGDTVLSILSLLMLQKSASIKELAQICNLAGAAVCGISGVAVISKELLLKEYLATRNQ